MTDEQVRLVQATFRELAPSTDGFADLFYTRLFELDPTLRSMFQPDLSEQKRKLMRMLNSAISVLDQPDVLLPQVQALGARHHAYGVSPGHYETAGSALMWTLESSLGPSFTPEVRDAWHMAYGAMSETMQAAPHPARSAAIRAGGV